MLILSQGNYVDKHYLKAITSPLVRVKYSATTTTAAAAAAAAAAATSILDIILGSA